MNIDNLKPYIREYGGGDDRWCWHRTRLLAAGLPEMLWNILCDGHGRDFDFAEYNSEEEALAALRSAVAKLGSVVVINPW